MQTRLLTLELRFEHDVVLTRQRARQIAHLFGFDLLDQTRIATAVSELARNVVRYAEYGRVEFLVERSGVPALLIRIEDEGPGIPPGDRDRVWEPYVRLKRSAGRISGLGRRGSNSNTTINSPLTG